MKNTRRLAKTLIFLFALVISSSLCLAFSNIIWMEQGQTITTMNVKEGIAELHKVKMLDVSGEASTMCGFLVDNSTVWIKEDGDANVNGVRIYVREIVKVHEQLQDKDICRVIIGGAIVSIGGESINNTGRENDTSNKIIIEEAQANESIVNESLASSETQGKQTALVEEKIPVAEKGFFGRIIDKIMSIFTR